MTFERARYSGRYARNAATDSTTRSHEYFHRTLVNINRTNAMTVSIAPNIQFLPFKMSDLGIDESIQKRNPDRSNPKILLANDEPRYVEKTVIANR